MNAFLSCMEKMTGDGSTREEVCPEKAGELSKSREEGGWDGFTHPGLTLAHTRTWSQDKS